MLEERIGKPNKKFAVFQCGSSYSGETLKRPKYPEINEIVVAHIEPFIPGQAEEEKFVEKAFAQIK